MIISMELKTEITKEVLPSLMRALSSLKLQPNAYDLSVNPRALFGVTTGYEVILKTKMPEVMAAAVESLSN